MGLGLNITKHTKEAGGELIIKITIMGIGRSDN